MLLLLLLLLLLLALEVVIEQGAVDLVGGASVVRGAAQVFGDVDH